MRKPPTPQQGTAPPRRAPPSGSSRSDLRGLSVASSGGTGGRPHQASWEQAAAQGPPLYMSHAGVDNSNINNFNNNDDWVDEWEEGGGFQPLRLRHDSSGSMRGAFTAQERQVHPGVGGKHHYPHAAYAHPQAHYHQPHTHYQHAPGHVNQPHYPINTPTVLLPGALSQTGSPGKKKARSSPRRAKKRPPTLAEMAATVADDPGDEETAYTRFPSNQQQQQQHVQATHSSVSMHNRREAFQQQQQQQGRLPSTTTTALLDATTAPFPGGSGLAASLRASLTYSYDGDSSHTLTMNNDNVPSDRSYLLAGAALAPSEASTSYRSAQTSTPGGGARSRGPQMTTNTGSTTTTTAPTSQPKSQWVVHEGNEDDDDDNESADELFDGRYYFDEDDDDKSEESMADCFHWCLSVLCLRHIDPTPWLVHDLEFHEDGTPYFPPAKEWMTIAGLVRHNLFNPLCPEFTSLQQFNWAVIIGILMGVYTALWKTLIEKGVEFVWESIPEWLLEHGYFTDLDGLFPLYHYMWIVPMLFGAVLSYIFVVLPVKIPGQNEWIHSLHKSGVQDHRTFWPLFLLSTAGMLSGLSLGPELPLVLTSGMFGSWLGLVCRQSMLQARVLNLTAASAAIGGFFGFPMAGALFVLELPHRSGLQYFEALTPSTISSIVAVITNRLIVNSDVTGYFKYPFLATSLPSSIFTHAIVYGLYGCAVGTTYLVFVLWCKTWVHDWFHAPREDHHEDDPTTENDDDYATTGELVTNGSPTDVASELDGLLSSQKKQFPVVESAQSLASKAKVWIPKVYSLGCVVLPQEAHRAALAGALAGFLCGWVAIFVPHTLFWGEAQLQSLIDKGRTPLPVIGQTGSPTVDMTALGYCLIDPMDPAAIKAGFSVGCAALISISKTFVIGLSLGTGIIGGHFWGPLFVGCAASHFFSDVVHLVSSWTGVGASLASYPCVVILCTMGAAHVVNFRAHTAIMLILTLTISAFSPEDGNPYFAIAGDYSAVFPLLVISVFISMIISRDMIFYKEQRNRGDILAVPQVLCEPGMEGEPLVANFDSDDESDFDEDGVRGFPSDEDVGDDPEEMDRLEGTEEEELARIAAAPSTVRNVTDGITQDDIEESFRRAAESHAATSRTLYGSVDYGSGSNPSSLRPSPVQSRGQSPVRSNPVSARQSPLPRSTRASPSSVKGTIGVEVPFHTSGQLGTIPPPPRSISPQFSSSRLDELLAMPLEQEPIQMRRSPPSNAHRRVNSLPLNFGDSPPENLPQATESRVAAAAATKTTDSTRQRANSYSRRDLLVRVSSFGEVNHQPSLMEQARMQAASTGHRRVPSLPRGRSSRKNSASSAAELGVDSGALSLEDIEHSFNSLSVVNGRGFQGPTWNQQG